MRQVRRRDPTLPKGSRGSSGKAQPLRSAHVDQTDAAGPRRLKLHLGYDMTAFPGKRLQIINIWRPLFGPLEDYPLALCDFRSVNLETDLSPCDLVYPHYIGESYLLTYNSQHRWFYYSEMEATDIFVVKCYDSVVDGRAKFAPHAAFKHPDSPKSARLRESIELRALVISDMPEAWNSDIAELEDQ